MRNKFLNISRFLSFLIILAAAAGSLGFMLHTGKNNRSAFLLILFTTWVLSPFVALLVSNVVSKDWPVSTRLTLFSLMVLVSLSSLAVYGGLLTAPGMKPAAPFLIFPLISWILILIIIPYSLYRSRKFERPKSE